jgi:hypothetical protein
VKFERDPLDLAVDRAHAALSEVARIAERRGALDLRRFADEARVDLLDAWERAE